MGSPCTFFFFQKLRSKTTVFASFVLYVFQSKSKGSPLQTLAAFKLYIEVFQNPTTTSLIRFS